MKHTKMLLLRRAVVDQQGRRSIEKQGCKFMDVAPYIDVTYIPFTSSATSGFRNMDVERM